ncbi:protein-L-isoaspartate O-methyltransferase family protein [Monashia sp. NPDC004114]
MDPVDEAFIAVPRARFLPRGARWRAGHDGPIHIGHGQTNSQPRTVADMLRLLDVQPGHRVLDVGSGSGWTTALLAHLTGPDGEVVGVELEPDLVSWGASNLAGCGMPWATIHEAAPDVLGDPEHAPFDRVLVSAEATSLPQPLVDQLADPGRMVVPIQSRMTLVELDRAELTTSTHGLYRFVPLRQRRE